MKDEFLLNDQLRVERVGNALNVYYDLPDRDESILLCDTIPLYMVPGVIKTLQRNCPNLEQNDGNTQAKEKGADH